MTLAMQIKTSIAQSMAAMETIRAHKYETLQMSTYFQNL